MTLQLSSPAFIPGGTIPAVYTCNGQNINPPLNISGVPKNAKSLVLVFDDPDAAKEPAGSGNTFDHWLIYNIPPNTQQIAEDSVPSGGQFGKNSAGNEKYIGPCPPSFKHKYVFCLLALDITLNLDNSPAKAQIEQAAQRHVIEQTELIAYYEQPASHI